MLNDPVLQALLLTVAILSAAAAVVARIQVRSDVILASVCFVGVFAFVTDVIFGVAVPQLLTIGAIASVGIAQILLRAPRFTSAVMTSAGPIVVVCFVLYAALSLSWSSNAQYGTEKLLFLLGQGILPGVAAMLLAARTGRIKWTALLVLGCAYALLFIVFGDEVEGRSGIEGNNPIWVARSALVLACVALWQSRSAGLLLRWSAVALGLTAAVLSGSRGPLVSFVVAAAGVALFVLAYNLAAGRRRAVVMIIRVTAAVGGVAMLMLALPLVSEVATALPGNRIVSVVRIGELKSDINVTSRVDLQLRAWERFTASPLIGHGLGSSKENSFSQYPHNLPLEIASELGVIGVVLWIVPIVLAFIAAHRERYLQILLLQVVLYSFSSGDLGSNNLVPIVVMLAFSRKPVVGSSKSVLRPRPMARQHSSPVAWS